MITSIDLEFADGEYTFHFGLAQIDELQQKTGKSVARLYATLLAGVYDMPSGERVINPAEAMYSAQDVRESIRLGLIGGGRGLVDEKPVEVTPAVANRLMRAYVYPARPLKEGALLALSIVHACIEGYEPPAQKKTDVAAASTPQE